MSCGCSVVKIPLRKNILSRYGYVDIKSKTRLARHRALMAAVRGGEPPLSLFRRLNALYVLNRKKDPYIARLFKSDRDYIRDKFKV